MSEKLTYSYHGLSVNYYKSGSGTPLIILHGWGSSAKVMMPLAQNLSGLRTCYVLDLPGFGETPEPPNPWTINDYADLIASFIHERGFEKAGILAHSFGGRITLKLCARQEMKPKLDKILITGGAGMKPKRSMKFYFRKYFARFLKTPTVILPGHLREQALNRLRKTAIWKSLGSTDYRALDGVMRETFVKTVSEYLESLLPSIDNEVLLLWGTNDDATPLYQAERMEKGLKNAALVTIDHAGHYAFLDQPHKFKIIAEAFFKNETK
ncbi:MAG TPA: alpha/beta hydrolase [Balneolales bacterium]|nr:alpha/beta hydrolase [Balneolales bacterium]